MGSWFHLIGRKKNKSFCDLDPCNFFVFYSTLHCPTRKGKEVCYSKYGCFSDDAPSDNPSVPLPQSPSVIGLTYKHFTRVQSATPQIIEDNDITKLKASGYDDAKTTAILVHGYKGKYLISRSLFFIKNERAKSRDQLLFNFVIMYTPFTTSAPSQNNYAQSDNKNLHWNTSALWILG